MDSSLFLKCAINKNLDKGVSKNNGTGTPKSSILIGFSIINHAFWGFSPIFGNTLVEMEKIKPIEEGLEKIEFLVSNFESKDSLLVLVSMYQCLCYFVMQDVENHRGCCK